ncbi:MAG: AraC family transcriptional regulator [Verrucomicrobiae bacterium]|nr:AraC family transcriptional regulator [Verrucomicrobiae bacterium]
MSSSGSSIEKWAQLLRVVEIGHFLKMPTHQAQRRRPDDYILIWVVEGEGFVESEGSRKKAHAGDLFSLLPGRSHEYGSDRHHPWEIYWVHFDGSLAAEFVRQLRGESGGIVRALKSDQEIIDQWNDLMITAGPGLTPQNLRLHTGLYALLGLLLHRMQLEKTGQTQLGGIDSGKLLRFMHNHISKPIRLRDMAAEIGYSPSHFARMFRKQFNLSPIDYIIHKRVALACKLLGETLLSIKEIAGQVGYADEFYFSRIFKKISGSSPRAYRERLFAGVRGGRTQKTGTRHKMR